MKVTSQSEPADLRILDLAADQVRKLGAGRLTIVSVAREAGMSHGNVYRYFPSKEALFDAISEQWLKPVEAGWRMIADAPDPAFDKLERIVVSAHRSYRDKLETDPHLFDLFCRSVEEGRSTARKHRNKLQSEIQRVLEEGMAGGLFDVADQRRALALVFDALYRFMSPISVRLDRDTPRAQMDGRCDRCVRLTLRILSSGRL
ncbi:MAG: TetR/AcrR family transcriptional regulator [Beijerinckiaceae bacterium]|nr:TetR/AcrR family transcriptional regulator [Beijerinckiaceae bacterium]MDO9441532.1 TetR/AcrR family transcriptional regulator [Beijerinckiaceae bacterium]